MAVEWLCYKYRSVVREHGHRRRLGMPTRSRNSRKRGVRASRARLYHALTEAGLRSQAALAERIADLEELEQAPKDLVSRVFREQPVELQTLERVARALEIEAWQLYRTSDEPDAPQQAVADARPEGGGMVAARPSVTAPWLASLATGLALVALVLWWLGGTQPETDGERNTAANAVPGALAIRPSWVSEPTLVVNDFSGDPDGIVAAAMRAQFAQHFRLAAPSAGLLVHEREASEIAAQLRSDAVIDGEVIKLGRLAGVRMYLYGGGVRQQVWAETSDAARLEARLDQLAANATQAVARMLGLPLGDAEQLPHYPLAPVQDYYLEGRLHLDGPASELNIRRAQGRFEAALRLDANFADAHAGLCEALLEEYWMEDAQRALNDASLACGRAIQLAPQTAATRIAHAHLLRVTGRAQEAVAILTALLEEDPDDAAALVGLVATLLALYRGDGDAGHLERALAAAEYATVVDPDFWKAPFWLASLAYFAGDLERAITAAEEARRRDENEYVLANLGTFYFCAEKLDLASDAYERAREVAPHSYVGDEFLGMLYYLRGEFEAAAQLRSAAIARLASAGEPEIHEMWGNLADAYLQSGQQEAAAEAFLRAVEVSERDVLQGIDSPADRASRAYYYSSLHALAPQRLPPDTEDRVKATLLEVLEHPLEPGAAVRVALAWLQYGRRELALQAFEQAVERCGGYAATPGLESLRSLLADGE
jgi:tetratricopeptide (TPR) repeat protein